MIRYSGKDSEAEVMEPQGLELPAHLRPRHVFPLSFSEWPLSPTGKLDRRRLAKEAQLMLAEKDRGFPHGLPFFFWRCNGVGHI